MVIERSRNTTEFEKVLKVLDNGTFLAGPKKVSDRDGFPSVPDKVVRRMFNRDALVCPLNFKYVDLLKSNDYYKFNVGSQI